LLIPILIAVGICLSGCGNGNAPADLSLTPAVISNFPALVVSAGGDRSVSQPGVVVSLAEGVSDADGALVSMTWNQESGSSKASLSGASRPQLIASDLIAGTYTFRLTATDSRGNVAFDEARVHVLTADVSTTELVSSQMAALDTGENLTTWSMDWDIKTVLPGSSGVWIFNLANPGLRSDNYTLLMGVANPMTGGKALKFANTT
jgi:hypothetical protein